jgi:hypothetical protein
MVYLGTHRVNDGRLRRSQRKHGVLHSCQCHSNGNGQTSSVVYRFIAFKKKTKVRGVYPFDALVQNKTCANKINVSKRYILCFIYEPKRVVNFG